MITVPLDPIPGQSLPIILENLRYVIEVTTCNDWATTVTITREDTKVIDNMLVAAMTPVIPYLYLEGAGGNFVFDTPNDELPDYTKYGVTHFLRYLTRAELDDLRNG